MSKYYLPLIAIGIFLIIIAGLMFLRETQAAQDFCNSINGTYKFNLYHFCNGEVIQKYKSFGKTFWSFEINYTYLKNPTFNESILENN